METLRHIPTAIPSALAKRYALALEELTLGTEAFSLYRVGDPNVLLDALDATLPDADDRMPYWAELWTSALALAEWCLSSPSVPGAALLELGCGLGLPGIAAARAGAHVTMTDYDEDALQFARLNARTNLREEEQTRVAVSYLDWRTPAALPGFDVVIGADIMYERRQFSPLCALLHTALRPGGTILLADPDRSVGREFLDHARLDGFSVTETAVEVTARGDRTRVILSELRPEH